MSSTVHPGAQLRVNALVLSLALGLAACGGGGGGGSDGGSTGTGSMPAPAPAPVQTAVIATQPAPQSAAVGGSATFSVNATGPNPTYQWRREGKDIAGATASSYTLDKLQADDDGSVFTVEVRNGTGSIVSTGAVLKVAPPQGLSLMAGQLGGTGNLDGKDGRFMHITAVAVAPTGLLYVTDDPTWNYRSGTLRTIDPATGAIATDQTYELGDFPRAIRFDKAGNRYEMTQTAIFKVTFGVRKLLAGSGGEYYWPAEPGSIRDGIGANAGFGLAADMDIDGAGNLYVADLDAYAIRKVDPAGKVTTLAGTGAAGSADGRGSQAAFQHPASIAVDGAGNVFVLDRGMHAGQSTKMRKVAPDGTVTTLALTGSAADPAIDLAGVGALAVDPAGNLYMTDISQGCRIRRIGADGKVTDVAGSATAIGYADGKGDAARFCGNVGTRLEDLAVDKAGNLIVLDGDNYAVRRVTPDGTVTTVAGRPASVGRQDGKGAAARFAFASVPNLSAIDFSIHSYELAADAQGNVYVGEGDRLRKVDATRAVSVLPPAADAGAGARYSTGGLAYGGSAVVVSNGVISRVDADGKRRFMAGQPGQGQGMRDGTGAGATFANPSDVIVDGLGNIYLHDTAGANAPVVERKITPEGVVTTLPAASGFAPIVVWTADKDGNVWGASADGSIYKIGTDGMRKNIRPALPGSASRRMTAIARDAAGNLYLGVENFGSEDYPEHSYTVNKLTPNGAEGIVAGTPTLIGVRFNEPDSLGRVDALAAGPDGIVYVMTENAVLRLKE